MSRKLPTRPNLDYLKREAKRLLRQAREGEQNALAILRSAGAESDPTLAQAQLALARDYGYAGWTELKADITARTPVLQAPRPAFRVGDFDQALAHYVTWLGFKLDWDWREAPGQPAIGSLSRDHCSFMINEHAEASGPAAIHLDVSNLEALAAEWNDRRPDAVSIHRAPPYEFPEVMVEDPWGNRLYFEGKDERKAQQRQQAVRERMRRHVERELDAGRELPTPEALRDAVGPPLGTAIEVLNEYPEYGALFDARRAAASAEERADE